jgi:protein SCO1/2
VKNFIKTDGSCDDNKLEACNDKERCMQIKKTRNSIIWLAVAIVASAYFLLIPNANQIKELSKEVSPTASLYSNPKVLDGNLTLIDDNHKAITLSEVANNKWSLLYFGYTSCPDVCPIDLAILNQTVEKMSQAEKLQIVFVSVDPARDVGKLKEFVGRFNTGFVGLSAKDEDLTRLTKALGVYHEIAQTKQRASQDHSNHTSKDNHNEMAMNNMHGHSNHEKKNDYLVDHTASYLLLNPSLELKGLLTNPHHASKMAPALDLIIETLD